MINIYLYPIIILSTLLLICLGTSIALRFAPIKIKILSIILFSLLALRYITLLILIVSKNIILLYLLKPIFFINYLCGPIAALVAIYIIMRDEKYKFSNIFIIFFIIAILYFICISFFSSSIELSNYYGYRMYLVKSQFISLFVVTINAFYLILGIRLLDRSNIDTSGIYLIIVAATIAIVEIVLQMVGANFLQENILSDFFWIIAFLYSLNKLKSRS